MKRTVLFILAAAATALIFVPNKVRSLFFTPTHMSYQTLPQIQAWIDSMAARGVDVSVIGQSQKGNDVHLLSFNPQGSKKALFLAYVHANEPVGLPTIQYLCQMLATPGNAITQQFPDVHFLFVPVLDVDGMLRNQNFYANTTMSNYLLNYYRPSLVNTSVYALPFKDQPNANSVQRTPATKILMKLIETYKPAFINELHCAEFGSEIYWSWQENENAELANNIRQLINDEYPLPAPEINIHHMMTAAEKPNTPSGGSTIDYARFFVPDAQVYNLELGMWTNPMKYDTNVSTVDPQEAADFFARVATQALAIYNQYWAQIKTDAQAHLNNADVQAFYDAFAERANMKTFTNTSPGQIPSPLTNADLFSIVGSKVVLLLRNFSLLYGLTKSLNALESVTFDYQPVIAQLEQLITQSRQEAEQKYVGGDTFVNSTAIVQVLAGSALQALATTLAEQTS